MMQGKFILDTKRKFKLFQWGWHRDMELQRGFWKNGGDIRDLVSPAFWLCRGRSIKKYGPWRVCRKRWKNKKFTAPFAIWKSGKRSSNSVFMCQQGGVTVEQKWWCGTSTRRKDHWFLTFWVWEGRDPEFPGSPPWDYEACRLGRGHRSVGQDNPKGRWASRSCNRFQRICSPSDSRGRAIVIKIKKLPESTHHTWKPQQG